MQRHVYRVAPASLAGAFLSTFSSCACAGLTEIITNPFGEPGPGEIISHVYDDAVSPSGDNFVGAVVTATQLDDGTASQLLTAKKFTATAVAKFSGNTQSYGLLDHGTFIPVFTVGGDDFNVTGSGTIKVNAGQSFGRSGNSGPTRRSHHKTRMTGITSSPTKSAAPIPIRSFYSSGRT